MRQSSRPWPVLVPLLCLLPVSTESIPSITGNRAILPLRGGSTIEKPNISKYPMEQLLLLQSRSARLRQALTERGLLPDASQVDAPTAAQPVDWDCALSTPEHPKSCLYSFDAEPYTKVVAPLGTDQWIALATLNTLRRTDPTKVEPMWHSQYAIFQSWFRPGSPYCMYAHLPWQGYLLSLLLDVPLVLNAAVWMAIGLGLLLTRPIWETVLTLLLTSPFLWTRWINWARFVHAALPLKLLLGQMAWRGLATIFLRIRSLIRDYLIQYECRIWEEALPLTILEGDPSSWDKKARTMEQEEEDDEEIMEALVADDDEEEGEDVDDDETVDLDNEY